MDNVKYSVSSHAYRLILTPSTSWLYFEEWEHMSRGLRSGEGVLSLLGLVFCGGAIGGFQTS